MTVSQVARDLQEVTEKINPIIGRAEKALVRAGLTCEAQIGLAKNEALAFRRKDDEWRLFFIGGQVELLVNTSRENRLAALRSLPRLEVAIRDSMSMTESKVTSIIEGANSFLSDLESRVKK